MRRIVLQMKALLYALLHTSGPVIVKDNFGMKMWWYLFDTTPVKKLITRENFKEEFAVYNKYAKGVVFDIGAHAGMHAIYLSRLASNVYTFEPVPQTFKWLKQNIEVNKCHNIVAINSAVGDEVGTVQMQIFSPEMSGWNSIHIPDTNEAKPVTTTEVAITTLDSYTQQNNIDRIDFLKIDVEGHELAVLKGARRLLMESRIDYISFEVTEMHVKDATETFDLLKSYGYETTEPYIYSPYDKNYLAFSSKTTLR